MTPTPPSDELDPMALLIWPWRAVKFVARVLWTLFNVVTGGLAGMASVHPPLQRGADGRVRLWQDSHRGPPRAR